MKPFHLHIPNLATVDLCPIVASIPHSGLEVPGAIAHTLNERYQTYLPHQDWHLNQLYDFLPKLGITVLEAIYSRYVVDLNRAAKPPFFGSFWNSVVAEKTAFNAPLYQIAPTPEEVERRVDQFYRPYQRQIEQLLNQRIAQFGHVYLFDLHSFFGPTTDEVCLGDVNGKSCSEFLTTTVESAFSAGGYQVARNHVFNGGYITRHYGKMPQVEALQIEVRYHTYLNADHLDQEVVPEWQVPEFEQAKSKFEPIFRAIALACAGHAPTG